MGGGKQDGRVTAVLERATSRIVGRYEETRRGAIVIPEDQRLNLVVTIPAKGRGRAEDGHQVVAELTSYPIGGRPAEGRVVEVLGWPDDPEVEVQSAIRRFDLPHIFGKDALAEAEGISETVSKGDLAGRVDLRNRLTVTIDGETARDFDDAVSLQPGRGELPPVGLDRRCFALCQDGESAGPRCLPARHLGLFPGPLHSDAAGAPLERHLLTQPACGSPDHDGRDAL